MSDLVPAEEIERLVGAPRAAQHHLARAVSDEQRVYILHSAECKASGIDLRDCRYSRALDRGIDESLWAPWLDRAVTLLIHRGRLEPIAW